MMKLTKPQKTLVAIIESEGGKILSLERGNHIRCDYTFDGTHVFSTSLPTRASDADNRWAKNFRSQIRRNKSTL